MGHKTALILICVIVWLMPGCGRDQSATDGIPRSKAAPGATLFIISPTNGETVTSPVNVKFGISGMTIVPAGDLREDSGHHHLLVDVELPDLTQPIPSDQYYLHFGKGQTETSLELAPGQHTLQLVLGDGLHIPHDPPVMSNPIAITVE